MTFSRTSLLITILLLIFTTTFAQQNKADSSTVNNTQPFNNINEFQKYTEVRISPEFKAQNKGIINVSFEVDTNGVIDKARIISGITPALDAEVLRIVQSNPQWKPAIQGGKRVRARYRIGIKITPPATKH